VVDVEEELPSKNNDLLFDTVFQYEDDLVNQNGIILTLENLEPRQNEFYYQSFDDGLETQSQDCNSEITYTTTSSTGSNTSNVSISLRNSLLKLRQKRCDLATLIEEHKSKQESKMMLGSNGTTTPNSSSSCTSSLNTNSHMNLYKQNLLNNHQQQQLSSWLSAAAAVSGARKPCMYMLAEGRCLRSDCRFVHDLKTITCKYWLEGECLKGDACEFLHDHVPEPEQTSDKSNIKNALAFR
jgi:hypothetical protein